jgi:hypothetical protein
LQDRNSKVQRKKTSKILGHFTHFLKSGYVCFNTHCIDRMELRNFTHFGGLTGCNEALNRREALLYIICARFFFLDPCSERRNLLFHAHSKRAFPDIAFPFCFTIALAGIKSDCYFTKRRRMHMHTHTHTQEPARDTTRSPPTRAF